MQPGTWGEWFGGIATAAATIVALYFGVRDESQRRRQHEARAALHELARTRLLEMDRWDAGTGEPDGDSVFLNGEVQFFVEQADRLGRWRARRAERILTRIYGARAVRLVRLHDVYRDTASGRDVQEDSHGNAESIMVYLKRTRPELVVDKVPPLRRRGAGNDASERSELRREFAALESL